MGTIKLGDLARDRDQLFAEAAHLYRAGARWWPDAAFETEHIMPQQEARYEADAWEGEIDAYLKRPEVKATTVGKVAIDALGIEKARLGTAEQRRIAAAMERLGWRRAARTLAGRWWEPLPTGP